MGSPSSDVSLTWALLLFGFLLGHSSSHGGSLEELFAAWKSLINSIIVPLYALCSLLYIGALLYQKLDSKYVHKKPEAVASIVPIVEEPLQDEQGHVNMTGAYKLVKNDNFEGFLAVQGVPWALRRAADAARPTHRITHHGKTIRIQIQGIIESETTYIIDGPPVEINIRGRVFRDTVKYLDSGDGIRVTKIAMEENYNIEVTRRLSGDRKTITMTSRAIFNDGKEPVQSVQIFERIQ